jgi:L-aminopeptidase/D-esterase-like protein
VLDGIRVGHYTDSSALTGCTVLIVPDHAVVSAEVRGLAPGTRELALLEPQMTVQRCDAIVLTGGSALGLDAASGVAQALRRRGVGFPTPYGPVPIVAAAVIYDWSVGDAAAPDAACGAAAFAAALAAVDASVPRGRVGAGTGATVGKFDAAADSSPGGVGFATRRLVGGVTVAALAVVNAFGDVIGRDGAVIAGMRRGGRLVSTTDAVLASPDSSGPLGQATTLVVVATDAAVDKLCAYRLARAGHGGIARATRPSATMADGDTVFAVATATKPAPSMLVLETAAGEVTADAIRDAVR